AHACRVCGSKASNGTGQKARSGKIWELSNMQGPHTVLVSCTGAATVYPSSSTWLTLDYLKTGTVSVQSVATTTNAAAQVYSVEWSLDNPSSVANWFSSGSSNNSSNSFYTFTFPISGLTLNLITGTSNTLITTTVLQSAI